MNFSFREKVFEIEESIIETEYPVLFNAYVYHLSREEIAAEKIRAILTRKKGRDLYDLWYLLAQGVSLDDKLIKQKLKYYQLEDKGRKELIGRVEAFSEKDFVLDLRPFVPVNERNKLTNFFNYLKAFLKGKM